MNRTFPMPYFLLRSRFIFALQMHCSLIMIYNYNVQCVEMTTREMEVKTKM